VKRSPELAGLSRDHHAALVLARRAGPNVGDKPVRGVPGAHEVNHFPVIVRHADVFGKCNTPGDFLGPVIRIDQIAVTAGKPPPVLQGNHASTAACRQKRICVE
jgi:hypothetical protein